MPDISTVIMLSPSDPERTQVRVINRIVSAVAIGSLVELTLATDFISFPGNGQTQVEPVIAARLRFDAEMAHLIVRAIEGTLNPNDEPAAKPN